MRGGGRGWALLGLQFIFFFICIHLKLLISIFKCFKKKIIIFSFIWGGGSIFYFIDYFALYYR